MTLQELIEANLTRKDALNYLLEVTNPEEITQGKADALIRQLGPFTPQELERFNPTFKIALVVRQQKLLIVP